MSDDCYTFQPEAEHKKLGIYYTAMSHNLSLRTMVHTPGEFFYQNSGHPGILTPLRRRTENQITYQDVIRKQIKEDPNLNCQQESYDTCYFEKGTAG